MAPDIGLRERCTAHGITWDCAERWSRGMDHHPEAASMFAMIAESDYEFCDDYFNWKCGGDGDNGEALMFALSARLELRDAETVEEKGGG